MKYGDCIYCGMPAVINGDGVSYHVIKNTDQVDHDQDADHVAVLEEKDLNNPAEVLPAESKVDVRLSLMGTMTVADFKETMLELAEGIFEVVACSPANFPKGTGTVRLNKDETTFLIWMLGYAQTEIEKVTTDDPKQAWLKKYTLPLLRKIGDVHEKLHES